MLFLQIIHNWNERLGRVWRPKQNIWRVRLSVCFQIPFQGNNKTYCLQTDSLINSAVGVILWGSRHPYCALIVDLYILQPLNDGAGLEVKLWRNKVFLQKTLLLQSFPADTSLTKNIQTNWREDFFLSFFFLGGGYKRNLEF